MRLDHESIRIIRDRIDAALAPLDAEQGIKFTAGSASFSREGDNATFKLELGVIGASGEAVTKEASDFKRLATLYGLKPEDLGRQFTHFGKTYKLIGLSPKAQRFPFLAALQPQGKVYKLPFRNATLPQLEQ